MKFKILMRKLKGKLTGKAPCTFDTKHGHDFERTSEICKYKGFKYAFFEFTVCKLRAEYNQLPGGFSPL